MRNFAESALMAKLTRESFAESASLYTDLLQLGTHCERSDSKGL